MEPKEFAALLHLIDQMIGTSEPRRAEYYRGYRRGIQLHVLGVLEESVRDHYRLHESYGTSGDHYLDAFAQGYRDGCRGRKPEDTR